jgi:hypothetical protein
MDEPRRTEGGLIMTYKPVDKNGQNKVGAVWVVKSRGEYYIYFNCNKRNGTMLLDSKGVVHNNADIHPRDLYKKIKEVKVILLDGWWYFETKIGVFDAWSGKRKY